MAHTVYTGKGMTLALEAAAHDQTALQSVSIEENAKPAVERLDKTVATSAAYEFMDDPLGPKGDPHATLVQTSLDSSAGFGDSQPHHLTMGQSTQIAFAKGATTKDDTYTHAGMYLQKRTTTIPYDQLATVEATYEALTLGTWDHVP